MAQSTTQRLRSFLTALPSGAQMMLMREFERAIDKGDDAAVATFVLAELRRLARRDDAAAAPPITDPMRLVFQPFDQFLTDSLTQRPGTVRRPR